MKGRSKGRKVRSKKRKGRKRGSKEGRTECRIGNKNQGNEEKDQGWECIGPRDRKERPTDQRRPRGEAPGRVL